MITPLRGPQGSRYAEPKRPRTGCQHPIATIAENRVVARRRILRPDPRHADRRRFTRARNQSIDRPFSIYRSSDLPSFAYRN